MSHSSKWTADPSPPIVYSSTTLATMSKSFHYRPEGDLESQNPWLFIQHYSLLDIAITAQLSILPTVALLLNLGTMPYISPILDKNYIVSYL